MRTAAINFSLGYTGENWFYERKNYVAHPPVPLNCCVENFRTTATILARLRLPSTKGYSTPYIKMWDVEPEQYIISWYGTGGSGKSDVIFIFENTGRKSRNLTTYGLYHNQGINFMGLSNTFPERAAAVEGEIPTLFSKRTSWVFSVLFSSQKDKIRIIKDELMALRHSGDV